jgi:hypothetical protein
MNNLLEKLAELEHKQWQHWRSEVEEENQDLERNCWLKTPYGYLPEHIKEYDREWAKKVIKLLEKEGLK